MNSTAVHSQGVTTLASSGQTDISSTSESQSNTAQSSSLSSPLDSTNNVGQNPAPVPPRLSQIGGPLSSPNETRIVYHVDDEETPYLVKLPIPHNKIKLNDLKAAIPLPRPHYKFFFKSYDKDFGVVKEEIVDDNSLLPIFKDRVVAWLVSTEGSTVSDSTNSQCPTEISAADRAASNGPTNNERLGLVGDSHPPSFHGSATDHCGDTATETESIISSRRGGHFLNSRNRVYNYKTGQGGGYGKYGGNRYHGSGHHHHHGHHRHYIDSSVVTSDMESTSFVDSDDDDDEDFLDTGVDDDDYEDYNSRISTTTEETSVSRQYARKNHRQRHHKGYSHRNQNMSRTSSLSSITESSMSLNVIQVTLNLDTVNFLGISLVGQTSKKGDGGIYVSSIMKGGAVDLDGRIEPGDMILQVNEINFENLTNDEAVQVIRETVKNPGPIKLLVAKCWDPHPKGHFTIPRSEPVRPIDPGAWVAHTEAARAKFTNPDNFPFNPAPVNFNVPTSIPSSLPESDRQLFQQQVAVPTMSSFSASNNSFPMSNHGAIESSSLMPGSPLRSSFKVGSNVTIAPNPATTIQVPPILTIESNLESISYAMASPNSGLDVRDRMWLKIRIPNAFIGSDVVDWLYSFVQGFHERRDAKKFASKLLKAGYIQHTINLKSSFSEKCYYVFSEQLQLLNKSAPEVNVTDFNVASQQQVGVPSATFEDNFSNSLRLTNDNFQSMNTGTEQSNFTTLSNHHFTNGVVNEYPTADGNSGHVSLPGFNQSKTNGKYKMPFMRYWDENSEIHNYGLFGPQPVTAEINTNSCLNDGNGSNHSGGTSNRHDPYQSDEQMSQRSGQSILYNPQAQGPGTIGLNMNTMASSGSNGSGNTNSSNLQSNLSAPNSCINNSCNINNGNLINHHYEDLQMNPATGNLVPSSSIAGGDINEYQKQFAHPANSIFQQTYRHNDSDEINNGVDASDDLIGRNGMVATSRAGSCTGSHEGESLNSVSDAKRIFDDGDYYEPNSAES